jgi:uncharacterized membrane protein
MDISPAGLAATEGIDRIADPLARVADRVLSHPQVRRVLKGDWLGHPLHPALTDLPIGFWSSAFVLDLGGRRFRRAADTMVAAGLLSVLPTVASGLADWHERDRHERRVGVVHAAANTVATLLYAGSLGHRLRGNRVRGVAMGLVAATAATAGGYLGGHLAFGRTEEVPTGASVDVEHTAADVAGETGPVDQQGAALAAMSRPA